MSDAVSQDVTVSVATAAAPGAIAIVQLHGDGDGIVAMLSSLCGRVAWPRQRLHLVDLAGIDRGLAGRLDERTAQLMPHGGLLVVRKLVERLIALGARYDDQPDPSALYPEAADRLEAQMLAAMATAASPAAIDLLAAQPRLWRQWLEADPAQRPPAQAIAAHSRVMDRLLIAPTVVVVGPPNVGKSTLTNRMLGRAASLVADLPGTTRDWVAGLAQLHLPGGDAAQSVAVRWLDTPGLRDADDPIEAQAIALARQVIAGADVLIAMTEAVGGESWPPDLPCEPDLWLLNKADLLGANVSQGDGRTSDAPLAISAEQGDGVDELQRAVLEVLQLDQLGPDAMQLPWAFTAELKAAHLPQRK